MLPNSLLKRFVKIQDVHGYNTRNKMKLCENRTKTNLSSCCISVRGVKMYNKIPENIKMAKSVESFKRQLKKYIISTY